MPDLISIIDKFLPYPFVDSYCMFFIYSFLGWNLEVIYYGVTEERFINRGFLSGPICPVYGLGFYAAVWLFAPLANNFFIIFFGMATACTVVELIAGEILYHTFHMRWWDYSDYKLNYKGYICLRFYIYWGIACSLGIYALHPAVLTIVHHIPLLVKAFLLVAFTILLVTDIVVTIATIIGFQKKVRAFTKLSSGMKIVSDKIGSGVYGTVDTIVTVSEPTKKHYDEYRKLIAENRRIEKEMAAAHRAAERAFAEQFTDAEKASLQLAKQAAGDSVKSFMSTLKQGERRLAGIVTVGYGASKKTVLALIRRGDPADPEFTEEDIDDKTAEENGNI